MYDVTLFSSTVTVNIYVKYELQSAKGCVVSKYYSYLPFKLPKPSIQFWWTASI